MKKKWKEDKKMCKGIDRGNDEENEIRNKEDKDKLNGKNVNK